MPPGTGLRARLRAELVAEIKRLAREQIAQQGASALSLRAIARDLGMVSSAIYRYFPSRDELLTALIIDSFDAVGGLVEQADAAVPRDDLAGRWRAAAHALRDWAVSHPVEYGLIYGTPVPGYAAPSETLRPANRYVRVLVDLLVDIERSGRKVAAEPRPHAELSAQLTLLSEHLDAEVDDALLIAGIAAWMNLIGAISLEVFGHLQEVYEAPEIAYAALVESIGRRMIADYSAGSSARP